MGLEVWFAEEMELQRKRDEEVRRSSRGRNIALIAMAAVPLAILARGLWCLACAVDLPDYPFQTTSIIWGPDLIEGTTWLGLVACITHVLGEGLPELLRRGWYALRAL